jgi:hypothetical protein
MAALRRIAAGTLSSLRDVGVRIFFTVIKPKN